MYEGKRLVSCIMTNASLVYWCSRHVAASFVNSPMNSSDGDGITNMPSLLQSNDIRLKHVKESQFSHYLLTEKIFEILRINDTALWSTKTFCYCFHSTSSVASASAVYPKYKSGAFLSASLYFSKRGAYWDRLCRGVVGWLVVTRVHCGKTVHPRPIVTMKH